MIIKEYYIMIGNIFDDEILFKDEPLRKAILPIKYPQIWAQYKKLQGCTWTAEEITFKDDVTQIHNGLVKPEIMDVVRYVLGFFSGADTIVNENLALNFLGKIKILEAQYFYGQQIQNENVHGETYSVTIEALIKDNDEKTKILNAVQTMPCIKRLFDWATKWVHRTWEDELATASNKDLAKVWCEAKRMVAFACVEGILFSSAFAIIFWIKEQGILPGLTFSNELISRDEGLHRDFACLLYRMIKNKPPNSQVVEIIRDAVEFNDVFIDEMLSKKLMGMNNSDMKQYVKFTADSLVVELGYDKIYNVKNPFPFMEKISYNGLTNFFERRVGEYGLSGFEDDGDEALVLDDNY